MKKNNTNILTIDCEDFLSLPAFHSFESDIDWNQLIDKQIGLVLDALLSANDTKATFFVVGEIAERNPDLIRKIENMGHHIGSHGNKHVQMYKLSHSEFADDLNMSIIHINNAIEKPINCYRAPMWSYKKNMDWFWTLLFENNIIYDSSIFPVSKYMFGDPSAKTSIHKLNESIIELPPSTISFFGLNIPFSGGIYFRFIPYWIYKIIARKHKEPIVMYFHPWELDPDLFRTRRISIFYQFILYYKTKKSLKKFKRLISDFTFTSIDKYFELKNKNFHE